jgi:hypothetical protein
MNQVVTATGTTHISAMTGNAKDLYLDLCYRPTSGLVVADGSFMGPLSLPSGTTIPSSLTRSFDLTPDSYDVGLCEGPARVGARAHRLPLLAARWGGRAEQRAADLQRHVRRAGARDRARDHRRPPRTRRRVRKVRARARDGARDRPPRDEHRRLALDGLSLITRGARARLRQHRPAAPSSAQPPAVGSLQAPARYGNRARRQPAQYVT